MLWSYKNNSKSNTSQKLPIIGCIVSCSWRQSPFRILHGSNVARSPAPTRNISAGFNVPELKQIRSADGRRDFLKSDTYIRSRSALDNPAVMITDGTSTTALNTASSTHINKRTVPQLPSFVAPLSQRYQSAVDKN